MARILVVDDMPDLRLFAATALSLSGHEVVQASSGQEAVELYTEALADRVRFELVVMDVAMPDMNGLTAAQKIRDVWPEQKVAFLTAFDDPLTYSLALIGGGAAFWSKPIEAPDLCAKVATLLE